MGRFVWAARGVMTLRNRIAGHLEFLSIVMAGVLDYENVTKDYGDPWSRRRVRALDGFTLSLERGEIFGFLGPNGAGKTTAIHLALGFMRPSSGAGQLLAKPFGNAPTRARVGFLAENVALYHRPAGKLLRFLRSSQSHARTAAWAAMPRGAARRLSSNWKPAAMWPSSPAECSSASVWRRR